MLCRLKKVDPLTLCGGSCYHRHHETCQAEPNSSEVSNAKHSDFCLKKIKKEQTKKLDSDCPVRSKRTENWVGCMHF